MENYLYVCDYCSNTFTPKRRGIQRFCRASCRASSHNKNKKQTLSGPSKELSKTENKTSESEKMSWTGIKNATAGALLADGIKHAIKTIVNNKEDDPATKKDLANLISTLKGRYFPIKNAPIRADGAKPFYDIQTQTCVYFKN